MGRRAKDYTGQRFGRLVAVGPEGRSKDGHATWLFQCDCGNTHVVVPGESKSCGCLNSEASRARMVRLHREGRSPKRTGPSTGWYSGMSYIPEYRAFAGARARCNNPKDKDWADYGGRGIEFRFISFDEFLEELGPRPKALDVKGRSLYSLNRIEVDGHYEKGNVRWATRAQQANNHHWHKSDPAGHQPRAPRPHEKSLSASPVETLCLAEEHQPQSSTPGEVS